MTMFLFYFKKKKNQIINPRKKITTDFRQQKAVDSFESTSLETTNRAKIDWALMKTVKIRPPDTHKISLFSHHSINQKRNNERVAC